MYSACDDDHIIYHSDGWLDGWDGYTIPESRQLNGSNINQLMLVRWWNSTAPLSGHAVFPRHPTRRARYEPASDCHLSEILAALTNRQILTAPCLHIVTNYLVLVLNANSPLIFPNVQ